MLLSTVALIVFLLAYGVSVFISDRVIVVISGISAVVAGILLLVGR